MWAIYLYRDILCLPLNGIIEKDQAHSAGAVEYTMCISAER